MYNMTCVTVLLTVKVFVSNFKVEKRENLDNAFYVFFNVFLTWHFKKNVKSRVFLNFQKNVKTYSRTMPYVIELMVLFSIAQFLWISYVCSHSWCVILNLILHQCTNYFIFLPRCSYDVKNYIYSSTCILAHVTQATCLDFRHRNLNLHKKMTKMNNFLFCVRTRAVATRLSTKAI